MAPQSRAIPVLITRPEPQASRFAETLTQRFGDRIRIVITPLLKPVFAEVGAVPADARSLILTSETGARTAAALRAAGRALPDRAYCVGDRTARVARSLGFQAISADGDAQALLRLLAENGSDAPFLHLRGRESRGDIASCLDRQGIAASDCITYAQEPAALSQKARDILLTSGPVAVPLFSPRTAELWCKALAGMSPVAEMAYFLLSPAIAERLICADTDKAHIAPHPTQDDLLNMMSQVLFGA